MNLKRVSVGMDLEDLELKGQTIYSVYGDEFNLIFEMKDGSWVHMYPDATGCCGSAHIENSEELETELDLLLDSPILVSELVTDEYPHGIVKAYSRFVTEKGGLTVRWRGKATVNYPKVVIVDKYSEEEYTKLVEGYFNGEDSALVSFMNGDG